MKSFDFKYPGKIGGHYKVAGALSLTPAVIINPVAVPGTGAILGSLRWTDADYYMVITAFGFQILCGGLTAKGQLGIVTHKVTGFTVDNTGGTDATSMIAESILTGMPAVTGLSGRFCIAATAAMGAGTRTVGKMVYGSVGIADTVTSVVQSGTIYQFKPGEDEPIILGANEGLEIQLPPGIGLAAGKTIQVNLIGSFSKIPKEVIDQYYGIA
jgi:hypothetical protein